MVSSFPLPSFCLDWASACQQKVAFLYSQLESDQLNNNEEFLVSLHLLRTHYKIFDPIPVSSNGSAKQEYVYPCSGDSDNCLKYCARQYKLCLSDFTKCGPCVQLEKIQKNRELRKRKSKEAGIDRTSVSSTTGMSYLSPESKEQRYNNN